MDRAKSEEEWKRKRDIVCESVCEGGVEDGSLLTGLVDDKLIDRRDSGRNHGKACSVVGGLGFEGH